jgi:type I restriction enzyme S subunit
MMGEMTACDKTSKVSQTLEVSDAFKETEIGPIPVEWDVVQLGKICQLGKDSVNPQESPGVPYVGLEHIDSGEPQLRRWGSSSEVKSSKKHFIPGDVLYGKLRPYLDKAVLAEFEGICSTDILVLKADRNLTISEFLIHILHTQPFLSYAINTTSGTNLPRTRWTSLRNFNLALPPLPEQRRIAHVLNAIQREIAAQDDLIAAAREVKRSLMHRLFTYGPGPEPAPTKETEFGDVPEHWDVRRLGKCAFVQTGVTKGRKLEGHRTIKVPYLRVANVQDGYLDLSEIKYIRIRASELERYSLQMGDVVLTEGGDFDKLGRGFIWRGQIPQCIHQNHVFAVRANRETLLPEYLAYLVQSDYSKAYFLKVAHRTTNLASINSTKLKALPTLVPTLEEQEEITNLLATADHKIAAEQDRKTALQALFKSMLHQLMTGQIRLPSD